MDNEPEEEHDPSLLVWREEGGKLIGTSQHAYAEVEFHRDGPWWLYKCYPQDEQFRAPRSGGSNPELIGILDKAQETADSIHDRMEGKEPEQGASPADQGYDKLAIALGGSLAGKGPTELARSITMVLGMPVFVEYSADPQEYPSGTSYGEPYPYIEVRGGKDHHMLPFVLLHEMAHALLHPHWTSVPAIHKEYQADRWALQVYKGLGADGYHAAETDVKLRMQGICQEWWEADISVHPVPEDLAAWCGWEFPPLRECTGCGEPSRIPEGETTCNICATIEGWEEGGTE